MEEKELTYKDVPTGYPLCFNDECTKKACCMHYQARLTLPEGRHHGPAIYPMAWQDGECRYPFRPLCRGLGLRILTSLVKIDSMHAIVRKISHQ